MTEPNCLSPGGLDRVHEVLSGFVDRGVVPGLVAVIGRGDEVHVDAVGTMALDDDRPVRADTIFRVSSMTKPVTAVATLLLVEDGVLGLDHPIDTLLPELAERRVLRRPDGPLDDTVPADRPITVHDLLTFTFGHGMVLSEPDSTPYQRAVTALDLGGPPNPDGYPAPDPWLRGVGTLPLVHQPGERWLYNSGSEVLGVLIARASGRPFDEFLQDRIFEPLGMVDTGFFVPADRIDRLTTGYLTDPVTGGLEVHDQPATGQWSVPPAFPSGASGLVSTAGDFTAFARMLLRGGSHDGVSLLSPEAVERMTTDQLRPEQKAGGSLADDYFATHGWGYGVSMLTHPNDEPISVGTYGWDGGLGTAWVNDPAEDLILLLLTQASWTSPEPPEIVGAFRTAAYQSLGVLDT